MPAQSTPIISTTPEGIRTVYLHSHLSGEYFGIAFDAGSRDESPSHHGLAHFVEHTIFKGTSNRSSLKIINTIEKVGGELNAYTTKEETVVYAIFPPGHLAMASSLVADIVSDPVFPVDEINREREVVEEEISSYRDIPSESIADDFEDLIFAGSPLGHNILGNTRTLAGFTSEVCRRYVEESFTADRSVVFYMGPSSLQAFHRAVARFSSLPRGEGMPKRIPPLPVTPFNTTIECDTHQAHTIIGAPTLSCKSPLALSLNLLTNMIGGPGMNSLLNIELREKRGLVYNVEASSALLTDTGVTSIYFGCAPEDTEQCIDIINRNLKRLAGNLIGSARLDRARKQFAGQLLLTRLQPETEALSLPRRLMRHNCCLPLEQRLTLLDTITPASLLEAASLLSPEKLSTLTMSGTPV